MPQLFKKQARTAKHQQPSDLPTVEDCADGTMECRVDRVWHCNAARNGTTGYVVMHLGFDACQQLKPYLTIQLATELIFQIFRVLPHAVQLNVINALRDSMKGGSE